MATKLPPPGTALAAAGIIGLWQIEAATGTIVLDRTAATTLQGDARIAGRALPLDDVIGRIAPEDRAGVLSAYGRLSASGGPALVAFRVCDAVGTLRHLQARGYFAWNDRGVMVGQGALLESDEAWTEDPLPLPVPADPLAEAAARSVEVRTALGQSGHGALRLAADLLLFEINMALAERHGISDRVVPGLSTGFR